MLKNIRLIFFCLIIALTSFNTLYAAQFSTTDSLSNSRGYTVVLDSDTLFSIYNGVGVFSASQRAEEISNRLNQIVKNDSLDFKSLKIQRQNEALILTFPGIPVMAVTSSDAKSENKDLSETAKFYSQKIINQLEKVRSRYSSKTLITNVALTLLFISLFIIFFQLTRVFFPWVYKKLASLEGKKIKSASFKGKEIVKSSSIVSLLIIFLQGLRFALTLFAVYLFLTETIHLWPYTRKLAVEPILKGVLLFVFCSVILTAMIKGINILVKFLTNKYEAWRGSIIKSVKIKSVELLSSDRAVDILVLATKIIRFALYIIVIYLYVTIVFSIFTFSKNWASTLFDYVLKPLNSVFTSVINFLPNLFFIIVLILVFRYLIKFIHFLFGEIDRGNLTFPGFHEEWAMPTYKIVRFLIIVLAVIIIFPYLPGSNSPFFQGISVFLGILFSLGSSSAISNIVAGTVITYMRPFKIGDRVKIADTVGDVVEKTLLVTRIRTIKNVDVTIPNSMVLGSHLINYSSSAGEKGLILNTSVSIGYAVPWRKVHELLISAASETENVLNKPEPFVLQTSLSDFYVTYELNVYTNEPELMSKTYSALHSKIQDKFNSAGIEIMSPHYSAMRDGNQTTIPEENLPKDYKAPSFRIFGVDLFGRNEDKK